MASPLLDLSARISAAATWRRCGLGLLLYSLALVCITAIHHKCGSEYRARTGSKAPLALDLRLHFTPDEASHLFESWGPSGVRWYLILELIDVPYIGIYAATMALLMTKLAGPGLHNLLPFGVAALDVLQNAAVSIAAGMHPARDDRLVWAATFFNTTKWMALCFVLMYGAGQGAARVVLSLLGRAKKQA